MCTSSPGKLEHLNSIFTRAFLFHYLTIRLTIDDEHHTNRPNHSGKSIFLCQVATTIILAQLGGGIPGKGAHGGRGENESRGTSRGTAYNHRSHAQTPAQIPIMKGITSRMGTSDRVTSGQSSFFQDCSQVACGLRPNALRYLHIIDEFGKGTSVQSGMCLLVSTLRYMHRHALARQTMSVFATHMVEVLTPQLCPLQDARLHTLSMQVVVQRDGTTVKTFRVQSGSIASESLAVQCAIEQEVDASVVRRIAHVAAAMTRGLAINTYRNEPIVPMSFAQELMRDFPGSATAVESVPAEAVDDVNGGNDGAPGAAEERAETANDGATHDGRQSDDE